MGARDDLGKKRRGQSSDHGGTAVLLRGISSRVTNMGVASIRNMLLASGAFPRPVEVLAYITINSGVVVPGQTGARPGARGHEWEWVTRYLLRERLGHFLADEDAIVCEHEPPESRLAAYFETTPLFGVFRELQKQRSEPSEAALEAHNGSLMHWYWAPRGWWPSVLYQAHERERMWQLLTRQEGRRGRRYNWVVVSRLDLAWLAPHPPLERLFTSSSSSSSEGEVAEEVAVQDGFDFAGVNDRHAVMRRSTAYWYLREEGTWRSKDFSDHVLSWMESKGWPDLHERAFGAEQMLLLRLCWRSMRIFRFAPVAALTCPELANLGARRLEEFDERLRLQGTSALGTCERTGGFRHWAEYTDAREVAARLERGWTWTMGTRAPEPPPFPCNFGHEEACCMDQCSGGDCFPSKHLSVARCCSERMLIVAPPVEERTENTTESCWRLEASPWNPMKLCSRPDPDSASHAFESIT
eukprot:TRINITY_DN5831_c0_g2_i1.p1 TRINITY_DN5831_c0_g2~~TRINITY_DN5831_c0_g2_i1.p1  ORF type:complete len:509 (-),score=99.25 TRINITY_DN5831_c0_g2_i1:2-1411(-)